MSAFATNPVGFNQLERQDGASLGGFSSPTSSDTSPDDASPNYNKPEHESNSPSDDGDTNSNQDYDSSDDGESNKQNEPSSGDTNIDTNGNSTNMVNLSLGYAYNQPQPMFANPSYGEQTVYTNLMSAPPTFPGTNQQMSMELLRFYHSHYYQPPAVPQYSTINFPHYTYLNTALTSNSNPYNNQTEDVVTSQSFGNNNDDSNDGDSSLTSESATTNSSDEVGKNKMPVPDSESLAAVVNSKSKSRAAGTSRYQKRQRTKFDQRQLDILEAAFERTHYPDINVVDKLSELLGLTVERISVWFQNRRARYKKTAKLNPENKNQLPQIDPNNFATPKEIEKVVKSNTHNMMVNQAHGMNQSNTNSSSSAHSSVASSPVSSESNPSPPIQATNQVVLPNNGQNIANMTTHLPPPVSIYNTGFYSRPPIPHPYSSPALFQPYCDSKSDQNQVDFHSTHQYQSSMFFPCFEGQ